MYRDLDIPYYFESAPEWSWVRPLWSSRGLQYVQTIRLGGCHFARYRNNGFVANIWRMFRRDSLVDVEFGNFGRPAPLQLTSLLQRQTNIRILDIEVDTNEDSPKKEVVAKGLLRQANSALLSRTSIQNLSLTISTHKDQTLCRNLLSTGIQSAQLREFTVKTPLIEDWGDPSGLVLLDQEFLLSCTTTSPTLVHISLSYCILPTRTILLDACPSLKKLTLLGCSNIGPVLDAFQGPKLTSLTIRDMTDFDGPSKQPVKEIASLLRRFSSLRTLILELTSTLEHEEVRNIANALPCHAQSLQSLIFGCRPTRGLTMGTDGNLQDITDQEVTAAIRSCTRLTEIAMSMDTRNFVNLGSVSSTSYHCCFRAWTLTRLQMIVHDLPHLAFINILWFPTSSEDDEESKSPTNVIRYRTITEDLLQAADTSTCRTIVAFAQPMLYMDKFSDEEVDWPERESFMGVRLYGLRRIVAMPVQDHLDYSLPDSKIVNYRFAAW